MSSNMDEIIQKNINVACRGCPIFLAANPYGYRLNLNNLYIRKIYELYKFKNGLATRYPISDEEREKFEELTVNYLLTKKIIKE